MQVEYPDHEPSQASRSGHRRWRWVALLAVLVALGMGLAACGGGSPNASSNPSTASDSSQSAQTQLLTQLLKFAKCMRSHGDPDYPDPVITNGQPHLAGAPLNTPQFQTAREACYKYTPAGSATPAEQATTLAQAVKFADCMRSHHEPNFPDPNPNGEFNLAPQDIDSDSPQFQAAQKTCRNLDPGLQLQVGGGAGKPPGNGP